MGMRLLGPNRLVPVSVRGSSPSVMRAIAEGSKVGPNTAVMMMKTHDQRNEGCVEFREFFFKSEILFWR